MSLININLANGLQLFVTRFNELSTALGDLNLLTTTTDSSAVSAINEVSNLVDSANINFTTNVRSRISVDTSVLNYNSTAGIISIDSAHFSDISNLNTDVPTNVIAGPVSFDWNTSAINTPPTTDSNHGIGIQLEDDSNFLQIVGATSSPVGEDDGLWFRLGDSSDLPETSWKRVAQDDEILKRGVDTPFDPSTIYPTSSPNGFGVSKIISGLPTGSRVFINNAYAIAKVTNHGYSAGSHTLLPMGVDSSGVGFSVRADSGDTNFTMSFAPNGFGRLNSFNGNFEPFILDSQWQLQLSYLYIES